jgi:hypothetical protein
VNIFALGSVKNDLLEARRKATEVSGRCASKSSKRQGLEIARGKARDAALLKNARLEKDLELASMLLPSRLVVRNSLFTFLHYHYPVIGQLRYIFPLYNSA